MDHKISLHLTEVPKELMLILRMISNSEKTVQKHEYDRIHWEQFLKMAVHHRLFPLLYVRISEQKYNFIPKHVVDSLEELYRKSTFRMLHLCGVMEHISRLFSNKNIRSLFLKGPILAHELYGDLSLRTCSDIDLLVSFEDLEKAEHLLLEQGYEKDEYIQSLLNDWTWRHHHFTYYHRDTGTKVEIHWRLNPFPSTEPSFNELWERKKKTDLICHPTYYLGDEDLFFALMTHGARHAWSRLRWLVDIHRMAKNDIQWARIIKHIQKFRYGHVSAQAFTLATKVLGTNIPKEMNSYLNDESAELAQKTVFYMEKMVNLHTDPVPIEISKYHKKYLYSLMSRKEKMFYLLSMLHPYYTDAETFPLPKSMHLLYFPLRPFLWMFRKVKKHAIT
ncbi:nucleotidyltransferase family protein [Siminovitchia sediminis]|uniref:Nucleotidyltransferase family protein n=1 Tax=Siminovitchia sediminis TaxID=1274353 RepID=A0ABW4KJ10_9BACI